MASPLRRQNTVSSPCTVQSGESSPSSPLRRGTSFSSLPSPNEAPPKPKWPLTADAKVDACRFVEFDKDGDRELDFEQFMAMMPSPILEIYTEAEIRSWFDYADVNSDGILDTNDYWRWSWGNLVNKHGKQALVNMFKAFDADGTGLLDSFEFEQAARCMGYGSVAKEIFQDLDDDNSGTVTYSEIVFNLMEGKLKTDGETRQLHKELAELYDIHTKEQAVARDNVDTSKWRIRGEDVSAILAELKEQLAESGAEIFTLIRLFDQDADMKLSVDEMEFYSTLRTKFDFRGPHELLVDVFKALDVDSSGSIGYDDLFEFVRGRMHSLDNRYVKPKRWQLTPKPQLDTKTGVERAPTLDEIDWDVETLRVLMKQMMEGQGLGPIDLLEAWDGGMENSASKHDRHTLSKHEFCSNMHGLFENEHDGLWDSEVYKIVEETFGLVLKKVKGGTRQTVGILHLKRWFGK